MKPPPRLAIKSIASIMALGAGPASFVYLSLLMVAFKITDINEDKKIIPTIIRHLYAAPISFGGPNRSVFCQAPMVELFLDAFSEIQ